MTQTARIEKHPYDEAVFLLRTPPSFAKEMGRAEFARWSKEQGAYIVHQDHFDALQTFARHAGLHLMDDRGRNSGVRTRPHECRHCSQPGSMLNPPRRCPACGEPWDPITPDDIEHNEPISTTTCVGCGHKNTGRFMFCSNCGQRMNHKPRAATPRLATTQRETLPEPVRVSTAIVEYAREHVGRKILPVPVRPNTRQVIHKRPVVDVDLPAYPEDATGEPGASGEDPETWYETPGDVTYPEPPAEDLDIETGELFPANQPPQSDPPPPSAQEPEEEEIPWYAQPARSSADDEDEENWWNKG